MADKPNNTKKKNEGHDENASDTDGSDIECETCGVSFSSVKNYGAHMQSKKHQRKLAEAKFKAKNLESGSNKKGAEDEHDDDDDESEQLHCEVCDKYFSGYIPYANHIKGSSHAKNLKKEKLKKQMKDMPEVIHREGDSEEDEDGLDDFLLRPFAKCGACQKQFSGPESLKMHMKSAAHHKKVRQSGALQKLKSELDPDDDGDEFFYKKCDTCQKCFSGVVPYKTHMLSNVHKKNLERKRVAEEVKEFCADGNGVEGYVCKECKKSFSDPLAFKSHLENNSHEKLKAKEALVEFLNAHPEIKFVTPFDGKGGDASDSEEEEDSNSKYFLICTLCHVSFSGPESAQDHVKSKKHESAKKERKMLKLLKEQKKNSPKTAAENSISKENDSASANAYSAEGKSKNGHVYSVDDFEMIE